MNDSSFAVRHSPLRFDDRGLLPVIVQDYHTSEVLMLAYMNFESLRRTRESGEAWFWSRRRGELWHKGATSGNFLRVKEILVDCDADTILLKVEPLGPACHTGARSCFHRMMVATADAGESNSPAEDMEVG